jgi:hypothetical protein
VTLLYCLITLWLPGAVLFRLPVAERDKRAALEADERLFWQVVLGVAVSMSAVIALAAAHRYSFQRLLVVDIAVAMLAAAGARFRLRLGPAAKRPGLAALGTVALVLLSAPRFFPPSEYVIGGKDPGVYVNEGVQIAQRGTIVYNDPVIASVPPFARDLFFPSYERPDYYSLRFMGFFLKDPDTGAVVGQFPHLFPASIAMGYGVNGLTGARRAVGWWAILGVIAVYLAGRRLMGAPAAWAAAALLALNVVQVWFARYPNAEMVMQALLFAALLASARAHVDGDAFFAPVAGALLGLLLFLRFDAVLGIAGVLAALTLGVLAGRARLTASFVIALIGTAVGAIAYMLGPMRAYADLPIVFLSHLAWWQYGLLALGSAAALAALAFGARQPRLSALVGDAAPILVVAAILVAAVYALFFREPGPGLALRDAYALRTFANYYLTVPGLLAALVGFALLARRHFWRAPELFTTVALFSCFFFYKVRIVSDHFWMARRFLPVILPGALLFAAGAALGGVRGTWAPTRLLRTTIGVVFLALLASQYVRAARPVMPHVEYAGIIPRLEALAGRLGDRDLLVVESRNALSDVHLFALPLAYIYDRHVLVLSSPKPDKVAFGAFLDWARTRYARVLFLGGGGTDLLSPAWDARAIATERFQIPEYDSPADAYPRFVRQKEFDYSLYELTPPAAGAATRVFDLDVGVNDDLHVIRFHAKETTEGRSFRWSRARSLVSIDHIAATNRTIVLVMSDGGRPPAAGPAEVTLALDNTVLGTVRVDTGFKPYELPIPPALAARLSDTGRTTELSLVTTAWKPETVLGTPDDRELGVMVDRISVK